MKRLVLLLVFSCTYSVGFAQQIMWESKWLGNQPQAFIAAIDKNQDTSIVVSGGTYQFNSGPFRALFMKYDKNGTQVWQKYGRVMKSGEQDIIAYSNGYLFAGTQKSSSPVIGSGIGLHWLNNNGDTLQNTLYGVTPEDDYATKLLAVNNDVYVLGTYGISNSSGTGGSLQYSLLKLSNNGTTQQWFKTYGSINTELGSYLIRNSRGNLVLSGISDNVILNGTYHPYLIEVNANGDTIRTKGLIIKNSNLIEENRRFFHNIAETADGNYIMSGGINLSSSPNTIENFIVKLDANFNKIWVYYDAVTSSFFNYSKVQQLSDGSHAVLMSGEKAIPGDYHIVKVSATGQFISRTTYNSPITGHVLMYDWEFLGDGSVVVAGKTSANEAYIARLNNVGVPSVINALPEIEALQPNLGQSYPNPTASETTIPYSLPKNCRNATILLQSLVTGRIVKTCDLPTNQTEGTLTLNLSDLPYGLYTYSLITDSKPIATRKLAVMK